VKEVCLNKTKQKQNIC